MKPYYDDGKGIVIYHGDCREVLPGLCAQGFDAFVTDPQYGVGESYESGRDDGTNVDCGLWALTYLRGTAGTGAITPGVKNLWLYPKPTWTGSFFYPAATGLGPWGFVCWQPVLFYGTDPYAGIGSRPDSFYSTEAAEKNGHPCPKPHWPHLGITLFNHTKALCEGTKLPYVMENVRAAQRFVGKAASHAGSFYLWGSGVPPLLPKVHKAKWSANGRHGRNAPGNFAAELNLPKAERAAKLATIPPELANCVAEYAERLLEQRVPECAP